MTDLSPMEVEVDPNPTEIVHLVCERLEDRTFCGSPTRGVVADDQDVSCVMCIDIAHTAIEAAFARGATDLPCALTDEVCICNARMD